MRRSSEVGLCDCAAGEGVCASSYYTHVMLRVSVRARIKQFCGFLLAVLLATSIVTLASGAHPHGSHTAPSTSGGEEGKEREREREREEDPLAV